MPRSARRRGVCQVTQARFITLASWINETIPTIYYSRLGYWQPARSAGALYAADPAAIFPDSLQRGKVPRIENVFAGRRESARLEIVPGITGADADELEHAGIAVTVDHA